MFWELLWWWFWFRCEVTKEYDFFRGKKTFVLVLRGYASVFGIYWRSLIGVLANVTDESWKIFVNLFLTICRALSLGFWCVFIKLSLLWNPPTFLKLLNIFKDYPPPSTLILFSQSLYFFVIISSIPLCRFCKYFLVYHQHATIKQHFVSAIIWFWSLLSINIWFSHKYLQRFVFEGNGRKSR